MEENRRDFIKKTLGATAGAFIATKSAFAQPTNSSPHKSVFGLKSKPLEVVRLGMIGMGRRNRGHLSHYLTINGVEINPGPTALIRTLRVPYSHAAVLVKPTTPCLAAT